ncbi:MAG: hypothetical protein ACRDT2_04915 [Natronosporangium sp.]
MLVKPRYAFRPEVGQTLGPEVADLAALAGYAPDPEQELGLDALFAIDERGKSTAFEFCLICSRQNLKTGLFKQAALGWLFVTEQRLVVWSAHEMGTTKEAFRDLATLIEGCGPLRRRLASGPSNGIYRGNGDEAIELASGQRIKFKARTHGGGRGLTGDKDILDEAFALKPDHMGSLLPTLSAVPDPQVVYGSTAGKADSDVLRDIRDRGRAGSSPSLVYLEWCAPEGGCATEGCDHGKTAAGCALDDPENWRQANPAMGRRITVAYIANERQALPPLEFARERLGWWDAPGAGERAVDLEAWRRLADEDSAPVGRVAFAVDMSPERRVSIGVAGKRADGKCHGEVTGRDGVLDTNLTPEAVPARLVELVDAWSPVAVLIDPAAPAGALLPALEEAGLEVVTEPDAGSRRVLVKLTATETAQAFGLMQDLVTHDGFRHPDQAAVNAAVDGARVRDRGDGAATLSRKNSLVDISPFVAVTYAAFGFAAHGHEDHYDVMDSIF